MVFDCLWEVVDVFGLNTGNNGKPFFKILNGANIFFLASHLEIDRERSHAVSIAGNLVGSATG